MVFSLIYRGQVGQRKGGTAVSSSCRTLGLNVIVGTPPVKRDVNIVKSINRKIDATIIK